MSKYWHLPLAYPVSAKSGPMRQINTLKDANHALTHDLPFRFLKRPHWLAVGQTLLDAAENGARCDIQLVYERLVTALEAEGWMTRARADGAMRRDPPPLPSAGLSAATVVRRLNNVVFIAEKRAKQQSSTARASTPKAPCDETGVPARMARAAKGPE